MDAVRDRHVRLRAWVTLQKLRVGRGSGHSVPTVTWMDIRI